MSIREDAINGNVTPLFEACAANEGIEVNTLMAGVAEGKGSNDLHGRLGGRFSRRRHRG